jgi:hypothetical protein
MEKGNEMQKVNRYPTRQEHAVEGIGHYWVEVYKDGEFHQHIEYLWFSGTDVHDSVKYLKNFTYPATEGYEVKW